MNIAIERVVEWLASQMLTLIEIGIAKRLEKTLFVFGQPVVALITGVEKITLNKKYIQLCLVKKKRFDIFRAPFCPLDSRQKRVFTEVVSK